MHRLDGCLELVGPGPSALQALVNELLPLLDERPAPAAPVLLRQGEQLSLGADARVQARGGQEHQREQTQDLRLLGEELDQEAPEPDGLFAEVDADQAIPRGRGVAFIEDQVDDGEHASEPLSELAQLGHAVGDARLADLRFGADQALSQRGLWHQERAGDFVGFEAAEEAQGQRHPGGQGEGRVAAGEDQPQPVVAQSRRLRLNLRAARGKLQHGLRGALQPGRLPTEPVDRPVACGGDDPPGWAREAPPRSANAPARWRTHPAPPPQRSRCRRSGAPGWRRLARIRSGRRGRSRGR